GEEAARGFHGSKGRAARVERQSGDCEKVVRKGEKGEPPELTRAVAPGSAASCVANRAVRGNRGPATSRSGVPPGVWEALSARGSASLAATKRLPRTGGRSRRSPAGCARDA